MSITYGQYVVRLAEHSGSRGESTDWITVVPEVIEAAEQRCYRELDLLATVVRDSTATVTANSRNFTLPSTAGRFVTLDGINIYSPVSTTTTRNPVTPVSRDVVDWAWPSNASPSATTVPNMFCWINDGNAGSQTVIFGPAPGAAFTAEVIGTIRPTALSSSNTTTFLTSYLPDLFMAASVVALGSLQSVNGGAINVAEWEARYQQLFSSANIEEGRKKFASVSWTSKQPQPAASVPQRG